MKHKVKLGLYGCGNRTQALLDSIANEGEYEVAALFDLRAESMRSAQERYGGEICDSPDKLVAHPGVEAFMISLDPFAHPKAFFETVEAGKPIFIEKPVAMTSAEAFKMMRKAREKNVQVHVGFMRRYLPGQQAARKFLAENDPGKLFSLSCFWFHAGETEMINMVNHFPGNFRLKLSQIPFHCCHMLDNVIRLAGLPTQVFSRGLKLVDRVYPSPDEVISSLAFANGMIGSFHYSSMAYNPAHPYTLHAENYSLVFDDSSSLKIYHRPKHRTQRDDGSKDCRDSYHKFIGPDEFTFGPFNPDIEIILDFLQGARSGSPMKATLEDAWHVAELAEAIETSWQENQAKTLPLNHD